jgi:3-hydroxymyristoyl/3-hydroxydecanoyl-(acyl carrier protein) dehydratase
MLQVTTITEINNGTIVAERRLSENDWVFALHFPGDPIFPGSLLIEGAGQVMAMWGWHSGLRGKPRLVKVSAEFKSPVSSIDEIVTFRGTMMKRNNMCVGSVDITIGDRYVGKVTGSIVVLEG